MSEVPQFRIEDDVSRAFSVKPQRLFQRENSQVYAIVGANPELRIISHVWFDRFDTHDQFRDVLCHVLKEIRGGAYHYWLADLRFLRSEPSDKDQFLVKEVLPEALAQGVKRIAAVAPERSDPAETMVRARIARAIDAIGHPRVKGFSNISKARRWLIGNVEDEAAPEPLN